jgi:hypothetical protein
MRIADSKISPEFALNRRSGERFPVDSSDPNWHCSGQYFPHSNRQKERAIGTHRRKPNAIQHHCVQPKCLDFV